METSNIHARATGFLNGAEYGFHYWNILIEYKDSFGNAENLTANFTEILPDFALTSKTKSVEFSEDGSSIEINYETFQYRDKKGKIKGKPSPHDVFESLRFILNRAVKEYAAKFPKEKPTDDAEKLEK